MDRKGAEMQQQIDETMAGLIDKLEDLGEQVSGTVNTVRKSVNSVRDAFDVKHQVRRHPLTALAGATALGFLFGFRSDGNPRRDSRNSAGPVARGAPSERQCAGAKDDANKADVRRSRAAASSWFPNLGETFKPEIAALRGVAVGALLEVVREAIMKPVATPTPGSAGDVQVSDGVLANQERTSR